MVATETEAAPAESTGPTVNIPSTEAVKAEPPHPTVTFMSAEPAEGEPDDVHVSREDIPGISSGDAPARPGLAGAAPLSEPLRQCASVELAAEIQPPATHLELDESLSAVLTSAEDKIDEEGEAFMEKHGNYSCGFTVAAAPVGCGENEEKLLLTNGEHNEEEEAAESCLEALEEELLGLNDTGERKHTEVDGRRVQFSNQVQYFEEHVFPPGMENGFEEANKERDKCSRAEDESQKSSPDNLKRLPFEKEKYYRAQMDRSEDGVETTDGEEEAPEEEHGEQELNLKLAQYCLAEKVPEDLVSEEEIVHAEEKGEKEDEEPKAISHKVTLTEPFASEGRLSPPPPAVTRSEVTRHQLEGVGAPQPRPCNLTAPPSLLPTQSATNNQGKTRPIAWTCV